MTTNSNPYGKEDIITLRIQPVILDKLHKESGQKTQDINILAKQSLKTILLGISPKR